MQPISFKHPLQRCSNPHRRRQLQWCDGRNMADRLINLRLRFLDDASKRLLGSSPAISAHLQTVRESIIGDEGDDHQPSPISTCVACGNLLLPGWSCESLSNTSGKRTRKERLGRKATGRRRVKFRCHRCNSTTTTVGAMLSLKSQKPREAPPSSGGVTSTPAIANSANTALSSKDLPRSSPRKRPRTKKSTLQSMLANRKPAEPQVLQGFGLGLMDIMKP